MSAVNALVSELVGRGMDAAEAAALVAQAVIEGAALAAPQRTARQERNRRYYEKKSERLNASERVSNRLNSDVSDGAAKESPPDPQKKITTPDIPPKGDISTPKPKTTPRAELQAVLDAEHADAVLEHRQRIRKPMTARGAKMLARKFADCPDPNAAADCMVANGWTGFEPQWMENRKGTGPPSNGIAEALANSRRKLGIENEPDSKTPIDITASA